MPEQPDPEESQSSLPSADAVIPEEILEGLDENQREVVRTTFESYYSGPLPSPQTLAAYGEVVPDGAERIFQRFELQSEHRMGLEKAVLNGGNSAQKRGQWFGFIIFLAALGVAAYSAFLGQSVASVLIAAGTLLSGLGVFIYGKREQQSDLESHRE